MTRTNKVHTKVQAWQHTKKSIELIRRHRRWSFVQTLDHMAEKELQLIRAEKKSPPRGYGHLTDHPT